MRTTALPLVCILFASVGCGPTPTDAGDEEGFHVGVRQLPRLPLIGWQFENCFANDNDPNNHQRKGLIEALQTLYANTPPMRALLGSVGDSQCIGGEEKGGLFPADMSAADRLRSLHFMAIRPQTRSYAFEIGRPAIDAVSNDIWRSYWSPRRWFDDNGDTVPNARYELIGYDDELGVPSGQMKVHVLDHESQVTIDIVEPSYLHLTSAGLIEPMWGTTHSISPSSSPDPYVQIAIDATEKYLAKLDTVNDFFWPAYWSLYTLQFSACPSLSGWPLAFDWLWVDGTGSVIGAGGDLIN